MLQLNTIRTFEILTSKETWEPVLMSQLEAGDVFRMIEPDGTTTADHNGHSTFKARNVPSLEAEPHIVVEVPVPAVEESTKPKIDHSAAAEQNHSSFPHRFTRGDGY